eukprot:10930187-Lingulodinium_polyedra.AAC.1
MPTPGVGSGQEGGPLVSSSASTTVRSAPSCSDALYLICSISRGRAMTRPRSSGNSGVSSRAVSMA